MSAAITLCCDAALPAGGSCTVTLVRAATSLLTAREDARAAGWSHKRKGPTQAAWPDLCPDHTARARVVG